MGSVACGICGEPLHAGKCVYHLMAALKAARAELDRLRVTTTAGCVTTNVTTGASVTKRNRAEYMRAYRKRKG